ncbi:MAG: shikimate kinase [Candidatus Dormibacteria bacterium]
MPARNLVLVGFMGSGKTSVGRTVAPVLGLEFVDLDDAVVAASGKSIVDTFREDGEPAFRRLEAAAVAQVAASHGQVIAPGGGAVMNDESWHRLLDGNLVVRLGASRAALLRRIRHRELGRDADGARPRDIRPLADVEPGARHWPAPARRRVIALMEQREARYAEAPHAIDTTGRSRAWVAGAVVRLARQHGLGGGDG